jgi:integrase/recombinase XerD
MLPRFEQFIKERRWLHNVSPATVEWHTHSLKWLLSESPTRDELNEMVIRMREKGLRATGANRAIRSVNAYLKWSGSPHIVQQLKEPQCLLPTFSDEMIAKLLAFRGTGFYEQRLSLLVAVLFDTGVRISEALGVKVTDVDFNDLLLTVTGKGDRERRVPISHALRCRVMRFQTRYRPTFYLLATAQGGHLDRHVMLRDVKRLCLRLGFKAPARAIHATRHTFALHYLRRGGSVFHLQKVLGHSTLEMSRRYCNLAITDLSAIHERVSLLNATT